MGGKPITREDARRMISAVVDDGLRLDGLAKREGITPGGVSFRLAAIGCGYREICKHAREGKTTAQVLDMVWPLEKPAAPPLWHAAGRAQLPVAHFSRCSGGGEGHHGIAGHC